MMQTVVTEQACGVSFNERGTGTMSTANSIRIMSVDDHPLVREGLVSVVDAQPDMLVVAQACSGCDAIQMYREHRPDVTLMDLRLPDMTGIDALAGIRREDADARVVILTTFAGDVHVRRALEGGARGYMLKSMLPKDLIDVIRRVHAGKRIIPPEVANRLAEHVGEAELTAREIEVLRHVAGGNRNRDIADILCITEDTVKVHIKHLMEKLEASDRTQAVAIGVRRGFIHL